MDIFTLIFLIIGLILMVASILKSKEKTLLAMKTSRGMMNGMLGDIIATLFLIGLILTFLPPETIEQFLGNSTGNTATFFSALAGSVTLIPAFVAFPLVGSLVDNGASTMSAAAFLTTLTMVGVVTFPLEKEEFGLKFTIVRNGVSFVFAIIIAIGMGVII